MTPEPETAFLLRRAEEEAILAIQTEPTPAARHPPRAFAALFGEGRKALAAVRSAFRIGRDGSD